MNHSSPPLITLVYTSTAAQPFRETALEHLLEQCRSANAERDITGMLLFRDGRFIQVLEGAEEDVTALAARIERDTRHEQMKVLLQHPIRERQFGDWTMGYRAFRRMPDAVPEGYRDSFEDLDRAADTTTAARALAELTLWFRVRSGAYATAR